MAFFAGAHAQIATSNPAATATPARTTDYAARIKGACWVLGAASGSVKFPKHDDIWSDKNDHPARLSQSRPTLRFNEPFSNLSLH